MKKLYIILALAVIAIVANFFFMTAVYGQALGHKTVEPTKVVPVQKVVTPQPSVVIPDAEVATRATEASSTLRALKSKFIFGNEINSIAQSLIGTSAEITRKLAETTSMLKEQQDLASLQAQQQQWEKIQQTTNGWLTLLTERSVSIMEAHKQLSELKETWIKTREAARTSASPSTVLQQIDETLANIHNEQLPLETLQSNVLTVQSRVAREVEICNIVLSQIAEAQERAVGGIFTRDSLPIGSAKLWAYEEASPTSRIRDVLVMCWKDISVYVRDPSRGLPLHLGIFIVLVAIPLSVRSRVHQWKKGSEDKSSAIKVFEYPYTAALLGSLILASGPHSPAPNMVKVLSEVLAVGPMIRLIRPVIDSRVMPGLFTLWILFALDAFRQAFTSPPVGQAMLMLETLAGIIALAWFLNQQRGGDKPAGIRRSAHANALRVGATLVLITLGAGFVTAATGYLRLSRILASEIFAGGTMALGLYALVLVASGFVAFSLRIWPLKLLHTVLNHPDLLEKRTHRLLVWIALIALVSRLLDYMGLFQPALSAVQGLLAVKLERGSISISVEDLLVFFLTVWVSYRLSAFIRFILQEDVYPRIGISRGQSYATSSLINYVLLALGFIVGLGFMGVNFTRVTILAGAFGVGIGFGLQSVVNNFVSGLILLFERPIHVGDTVELGDLLGEVRRIGIRASTVRTWQGADIIVPNADLVTKQVTNWTLGDKLRRIDLPVGINYGADPEAVIGILKAVAEAHPDVLKSPKPQGLFTGYGDSSINFELRAWTDKFDDWPRVRSDLAVALYDAGHKAGLSFPFPQREVRLLDTEKTKQDSSEK